ncbi:MAG TPA: hypothetical protein VMS21_07180, partial [Methylomirabilota bacterium]|nr:hypothetical protein [Methylomirabilota bacterium]
MKTRKEKWPRTVSVGNVKVRVYRVERATGYTSFQVANSTSGRRRLESFANEREAMNRAVQIARQLSSGEVTAAGFRNGDAASYGRAIELLRPTGSPLEIVAANYAKACEVLGSDLIVEAARYYAARHQKVTPKPVGEAVQEFLEQRKRDGVKQRTYDDLRSR